jgi:hypothetical protein
MKNHPFLFIVWIAFIGWMTFEFYSVSNTIQFASIVTASSSLILYLLHGLFESLKGNAVLPESSNIRGFLLTRLGAFLSLLCFLIWLGYLLPLLAGVLMADLMLYIDAGTFWPCVFAGPVPMLHIWLNLYLICEAVGCGRQLIWGQPESGIIVATDKADEERAAALAVEYKG